MRWYVLQVMSGKEQHVALQLEALGIKALVPVQERMIHTKGEWITKPYIIFTSYVFVYVHFDADTWYKVSSIPDVICWLGNQKEPTPLDYYEAEWICLLGYDGDVLPISDVKVNPDGKLEVLNGILMMFKSRIESFNKRQKYCEVLNPIYEIGKDTFKLYVNVIHDKDTGDSIVVDSSCDTDSEDINN